MTQQTNDHADAGGQEHGAGGPVAGRDPRAEAALPPVRLLLPWVLLASAAVLASAYAFATDAPRLLWIAPVGALVGLGLVALAFARFGLFVVTVLATRTSLDAFKLGDSAAIPDPAALLGILFIGVGVIWLIGTRNDPEVRSRPRAPLTTAALVFLGAALLGVVVSPAPIPSLIEFTRIASMVLMFLVVQRLAATPVDRARLVGAMAAAAVLPLLVAGFQLVTNTNLFAAGGFERIRGTFTHSNPLAAYLAIMVVVAFAVLARAGDQRHRTIAAAGLAVGLPALLLTYTRAAWLAALVGALVIAAMIGRRAVAGLVVAGVLVVVLVPGVSARFADLGESESASGQAGNSLTWRAQYWTESIGLARVSPVTGIGLKQIAAQTEEAKQPHNDVVRSYVELGVLGVASLVGLMATLGVTAVRAARTARGLPAGLDRALLSGFAGVAAGYLLMSLVMNLFSQVVVGMYFYALAGIAVAAIADRQRADATGGGSLSHPEHREA